MPSSHYGGPCARRALFADDHDLALQCDSLPCLTPQNSSCAGISHMTAQRIRELVPWIAERPKRVQGNLRNEAPSGKVKFEATLSNVESYHPLVRAIKDILRCDLRCESIKFSAPKATNQGWDKVQLRS